MAPLRGYLLPGSAAVAGLLLVMIGLSAPPAAPAELAPPPPIQTRAVSGPVAVAELPREDGVPVLPATQAEPTVLTFTLAARATPLVEEEEAIERPGAVERIVIPRISLDSEVAQVGIARHDGELRYEAPNHLVGQYRGVNPGEGGNVVLAGHVGTRDGRGGHVFRDLQQMELGDRIELYTDAGLSEYVVREIRFVEPTAVEIMTASDGEQLTLITCRSCNVGC